MRALGMGGSRRGVRSFTRWLGFDPEEGGGWSEVGEDLDRVRLWLVMLKTREGERLAAGLDPHEESGGGGEGILVDETD